MADREVSVKIDIAAGQDQISPQARQQAAALEEVRRKKEALDQAMRASPAPAQTLAALQRQTAPPPPSLLAQQAPDAPALSLLSRQAPGALTQGVLPNPLPVIDSAVLGALSRLGASPALQGRGATNPGSQATSLAHLRASAPPQLSMPTPPAAPPSLWTRAIDGLIGRIDAASAPRDGGGQAGGAQQMMSWMAAQRIGSALPNLVRQSATFNPNGNALAGVGAAGEMLQHTFGALPGPLGLAANLGGAFAQAVSAVGDAFKRHQPTLAEENSLLRERQGLMLHARSTGLPSAENLRTAFQGTDLAALLSRAQGQPGMRPDVILQGARTQAVQERTQLEGLNLGQGRGELEQLLMQMRDAARAGEGPLPNGGQSTAEQRARRDRLEALRARYQVRDADLPAEFNQIATPSATAAQARVLTDAQIRQMAETIMTGRLTRAQSRVELSGAILRGGIMPDLRPGAPGLDQLPAFTSRQTEVLDIHAQVQQEAVRDQRQQMQFEAEQALRTRILSAIERLQFNPPAVIG